MLRLSLLLCWTTGEVEADKGKQAAQPFYVQGLGLSCLDTDGFSSEYPASSRTEGRSLRWKRVFVQTDNGSVLGIELERGENAHTVKKKLQIALNVSTEESSLTFGDLVLNNDLSSIRNDSPLLLTRNQMHRSSSTRCLSHWKRCATTRP